MTREEAIAYGESKKARIQEKLRRAGSSYGDYAIYYSEMAFTSAALAALREQEERLWIPFSDPPKEKGCYFVTVKHWLDGNPVAREAYWNGADWLSCEKKQEITPRVTHWMPMPEPPKEDAK